MRRGNVCRAPQFQGPAADRSNRDAIGPEFWLAFSVAGADGKGCDRYHRSPPDYWGWEARLTGAYLVLPDGQSILTEAPYRDKAGNWAKLPNWSICAGRPKHGRMEKAPSHDGSSSPFGKAPS